MVVQGKTEPRGLVDPILVAVDTGGTFTDVVTYHRGELRSVKVPSTPADPSVAVLDGLARALSENARFDLIHGSTVATNALLERKGARVFLVTNGGFQDVIEIGRQNRPQLYALEGHRPAPLVEREDRIGIAGRLDQSGVEIEPTDPGELRELAGRLGDAEAVAVCLLHSYACPDHEELVAAALAPLAAAGIPLSVSSRVLPEFREYERTATTVVNAYVAPVMSRYLTRLSEGSGADSLRIMGSGGGALPVERAIREPVRTVLSGPAGGVVGAMDWARRAGIDRILSFDMGGTSTDVSLCPGRPLYTREFEIASTPVALPVIDIHTVGAGGGSIATVDSGGALRVGPRSAGADPGPICYGKGGTEVTVTDAQVWLGRLPVEGFLGGTAELERDAIGPRLEALAAQVGRSPGEVAEGIVEVANTAMERALRVISVERGQDPAEFVLVGFGGAGGLHVAELAERIGAAGVLVPPHTGLLSAYGMLVAPVVRSASRSMLVSSDESDADARVRDTLAALAADARETLQAEGFPAEVLDEELWVEARYRGQSFELRVPARDWCARFHAAHEQRYGYTHPESAVEAVTVRASVRAPGTEVRVDQIPGATDRSGSAARPRGAVRWRGKQVDAVRVWREELGAGSRITGPAVILEYSSTTWVPPEWTLEVDRWGSLHLSRGR
jgi:N-methylhydantoinase A